MNGLSWLIYLADVAGTLKWVTGLSLVPLIVATVFVRTFHDNEAQIEWDYKAERVERNKKAYPEHPSLWDAPHGDRPEVVTYRHMFRPLVAMLVAFALIYVASPSSSTLYAIAASEMGEQVLSSETGGKAVQALNAWLDKQIAK